MSCYCEDNQWIANSPNYWGRILDGKCALPPLLAGDPIYHCLQVAKNNDFSGGNYNSLFRTILFPTH
jgi:hypothetical protein